MGFGQREMVNVVNKGTNTYKEEFMGRQIELEPGGKVQMTRREAVNFLGTFSGMDEKKKMPIEKNLVIEHVSGKRPEPDPVKPTCNRCGRECQNDEDLIAHIREQHPGENEAEKDGTVACPVCGKTGIKGKAGLKIHLGLCKG